MKLIDFVENFSHNNEIYIENNHNYRMTFYFNENDTVGEEKIMDWYIRCSNIKNCDVVCIKQVFDTDGKFNAITIKVDTDKKALYPAEDEKFISRYMPLWFYEKVYNINVKCGVI